MSTTHFTTPAAASSESQVKEEIKNEDTLVTADAQISASSAVKEESISQVEAEPIKENEKIAIVIDSNVLIKQIRLRDLLNLNGDRVALGEADKEDPHRINTDEDFNNRYEVHTLIDVIKEIRDENARLYIQNLPYELKVHGEEYLDGES